MTTPISSGGIFPLGHPQSGEDARFTIGLVLDVLDVLAEHGYPNGRTPSDCVAMQQTLFRFLYGPLGMLDAGQHTAGCSIWASEDCDCAGGRS